MFIGKNVFLYNTSNLTMTTAAYYELNAHICLGGYLTYLCQNWSITMLRSFQQCDSVHIYSSVLKIKFCVSEALQIVEMRIMVTPSPTSNMENAQKCLGGYLTYCTRICPLLC